MSTIKTRFPQIARGFPVWKGFMKIWCIFPDKEIIRKIADQITKGG